MWWYLDLVIMGDDDQYGKYDQFGNPLWTTTYSETAEELKEREQDLTSISNITSTFVRQTREQLQTKAGQAQFLASLFSVKEYLKQGKDPAEIESLEEFQEALQLKQKLAKAEEKYIKKFKDGFYVNPKDGTIRYFDSDKVKYQSTRKVTPIPDTELLIFPVEHKTIDGSYTIYTVILPEPEQEEKKKDKRYHVCHELIGYTEIPQMGVGIEEMNSHVIAFGSGKIPLCNLDHYDHWCYEAQEIYKHTGKIPDFNDNVWLLEDNSHPEIKYDPYQSGTYTPLIPCKGVYSRQVIKKKPKYSSEYRNESAFDTFTGTGTTFNVRDPHTGTGIICYEDCLNIVGAHKSYSQDSDYEPKARLTKLLLILRQVKVEKEEDIPFESVMDMIVQEELRSDVLYSGSMTLGPNFNPRPENVQVINMPARIDDHQSDIDRTDQYAAPVHTDMANMVKELHPLHLRESVSDVPPDEPRGDTTATITLSKTSDTIVPLQDENIESWAVRAGHLSKEDAEKFVQLFDEPIKVMDSKKNNPVLIKSHELMTALTHTIDAHITARKRTERMFTNVIPNLNTYSQKMKGMGYQFEFDHRFRPFIENKLSSAQVLLTYTVNGLNEVELRNIIDFDKLKTVTGVGYAKAKTIKIFNRHGDLFRTAYGKVNNGKTFQDLIYLLALFIEFYSVRLADTTISYGSYAFLMEKKPPAMWRLYNQTKYIPWPFVDLKLCDFLLPTRDVRERALDSLLSWHCFMVVTTSYLKHDKHDLKGSEAAQIADEFLRSEAVEKVMHCDGSLSTGMAYFDRFFDCPLLCQYGEIGGLDATWKEHGQNPFFIKKENFVPVQENFKGGLLIKYSHQEDPKFEDPEGFFGNVMRFDRSIYRYWTFLTPTWQDAMKRTEFGRNLLAWNEVFRGPQIAKDFLESVATHRFTDSLGNSVYSDRILEVPKDADVMKVLAVRDLGPTKERTLQQLVAASDLAHEAYRHNIETDTDAGFYWEHYYNMMAKQTMWSAMFTFANYIAPNHTPWETTAGDQSTYDPVREYAKPGDNILPTYQIRTKTTDADGNKSFQYTKHLYYPYSDPLSTQTFNISDYVTSGGDFTLHGSGMHWINKIIPKEDFAWYNQQSDAFKKVFLKQGSDYAWNYQTALRPFGTHLWVNDHEIDITPYFERPYFRVGNRLAISSVGDLED